MKDATAMNETSDLPPLHIWFIMTIIIIVVAGMLATAFMVFGIPVGFLDAPTGVEAAERPRM
ncbi:MAG: hypothetical protein H7840_10395 [Alphaproteobacteria bacterium]